MKFLKYKANPEIIAVVSDNGKTLCIIGQVSDLLKMNLIYEDNTSGNFDKWLLIDRFGRCVEFDSKKDAKVAARLKFGA